MSQIQKLLVGKASGSHTVSFGMDRGHCQAADINPCGLVNEERGQGDPFYGHSGCLPATIYGASGLVFFC